VCYYNYLPRNYIAPIDLNLGIDYLLHYRYNSARGDGCCPTNIWHRISGKHNWDDQISYFKKNGKVFLLDHWDEDFINALDYTISEFKKAGLVFVLSLFDGCGLKYSPASTNTYTFKEWNDKGLDGGSVDKFFRFQGVWWNKQCEIVSKLISRLGHHKNLVLELANEPFGSDHIVIPWHEQMMAFIVQQKNIMGYPWIKISVNARWAEMACLGCEYVWTHQQNGSVDSWNSIHELNPNGFDNLPGKCGKSFDWRHGVDFEPHVYKAHETGHSIEVMATDGHNNHWQVKRAREDILGITE
jgi:hypothetical protein